MEVKHLVEDQNAEERTHPVYSSLPEQWERQVQAIQRLRVGEAFVRLADDTVHKIRTKTLPKLGNAVVPINEIRQEYLARYFLPVNTPPPAYQRIGEQPLQPIIRRRPTGF
jgi:hypothetical protein